MMKNKKFLISIIFFLLADMLILAAFSFVILAVNKEKESIIASREILAKNEKNINSNSLLKKLASDIKDDKLKIYSMFLNKDELVRVIKSLESIESDSGVSLKLSSIDIDESQSVATPALNFTVKGTFPQLFRYLYFLENLPYLVIIDKAAFYKSGSDKENLDEWQATFSVKLEGYEK